MSHSTGYINESIGISLTIWADTVLQLCVELIQDLFWKQGLRILSIKHGYRNVFVWFIYVVYPAEGRKQSNKYVFVHWLMSTGYIITDRCSVPGSREWEQQYPLALLSSTLLMETGRMINWKPVLDSTKQHRVQNLQKLSQQWSTEHSGSICVVQSSKKLLMSPTQQNQTNVFSINGHADDRGC